VAKPTLESDLLAWADLNLPEAVAYTRSQSGEMRRKALARVFVRRFKVDGGWGNGFESWIEDMRMIHNRAGRAVTIAARPAVNELRQRTLFAEAVA